jgi:hypothetical protein
MEVSKMDRAQMCYLIARLVGWKKPDKEWLQEYHGTTMERIERLDPNLSPVLYKGDDMYSSVLYPDTLEESVTDWKFLMNVIGAIERYGMTNEEDGLKYNFVIDSNLVYVQLNRLGAHRMVETNIEGELDKREAVVITIAKWVDLVTNSSQIPTHGKADGVGLQHT